MHPKGTLMFDVGAVPDSHFKADGAPVTEGIMSASKPLKPQLAAAGYSPADITYLAMSHYHSDHTANANDFAAATWIVQKAERDFMLADKPQGIIQPDALQRAAERQDTHPQQRGPRRLWRRQRRGHVHAGPYTRASVLFVKLAKRGPVVLSGDLYHYPEERTTGKIPTFEFNADQSKASRAKVEAFMKQNKAELWIEHDIATHAKLPKAPAFVE